jgi:hypothetical protein
MIKLDGVRCKGRRYLMEVCGGYGLEVVILGDIAKVG